MGDFFLMLYHNEPTHAYKWKWFAKYFELFILELVLIAVLSGAQVETIILPCYILKQPFFRLLKINLF